MRAIILAAGVGKRMRPLSAMRPKPALPVRGLPLVAYTLELLSRHGVREVIVNLHHLADAMRRTVLENLPSGMHAEFSKEDVLLGTGGGIRRAAPFLAESDSCLVVGGDMLLDADLTKLVERHGTREDSVTFLLADDPRAAEFGTVGIDAAGRVRRIGRRFDQGGEASRGVYIHAMVLARRALDTLPERDVFNHLDDWIAPRIAEGADDVRAELCSRGEYVWEPCGTPGQYLRANLRPERLSYVDGDARARALGARLEPELVIGANATLGDGAQLERAVVWDGERVPGGFRASDGVFAGGAFHSCPGWEASE